jgi:hypothetical protein
MRRFSRFAYVVLIAVLPTGSAVAFHVARGD